MQRLFPFRLRFFLAVGLSSLVAASSDAAPPIEQSVKAAFVAKFVRYVDWPVGARPAGRPVEICIVGSDPFGGLIDQAARSDPNAFVVRRMDRAEQAQNCGMAFLAGTRQQSTVQMVDALQYRPVLTITDSRLGPGRGIIHFAVRDGKVGFHIDDAMAGRSRLTISSRLLQLALTVQQRRR